MSKIIETLVKFDGIIGAVAGVAVTLIVTHVLRSAGKIHYHFNNWKFEIFAQDRAGGLVVTDDVNKACSSEYQFEISLFNSSDIPKALRDISVNFYDNNNGLLYRSLPYDASTRRRTVSSTIADKLITDVTQNRAYQVPDFAVPDTPTVRL